MPIVRAFDTETTGLFPKGSYDLNEGPWLLQFSSVSYNTETNEFSVTSRYIKPPSYVDIPESSTKIHGITREKVDNEGCDINHILEEFCKESALMGKNDETIAHNLAFDTKVLNMERARNKIADTLFPVGKKYICTMKKSKNIVGSRGVDKDGKYYIKYPKLVELHQRLFPDEIIPNSLHDSLVDTLVCIRCYILMIYHIDINEKNSEFKKIYNKHCNMGVASM